MITEEMTRGMTKKQANALVTLIYAVARKTALDHYAGIVKDHYLQKLNDEALKAHAGFLDAFAVDGEAAK
jgi:hypothetical protein